MPAESCGMSQFAHRMSSHDTGTPRMQDARKIRKSQPAVYNTPSAYPSRLRVTTPSDENLTCLPPPPPRGTHPVTILPRCHPKVFRHGVNVAALIHPSLREWRQTVRAPIHGHMPGRSTCVPPREMKWDLHIQMNRSSWHPLPLQTCHTCWKACCI